MALKIMTLSYLMVDGYYFLSYKSISLKLEWIIEKADVHYSILNMNQYYCI